MTQDSPTESPGVSRRTFLGAGAATGVVAYLTLIAPRAEAAPASPPILTSESTPPQRVHRTLLGLL
ncbi:twin-arginine translocation signal domain-containing protein [Leifsonia poae]|uniref:twin-arginine translocation signal domain-containing protein n=1 Tax=Leifsonia poae TaxID=110933 RepID=UPI001CBF2E0E|nr:twin-arginine translocation signal domain-containing protein [Leifsonia poae]